MSSPQREPGGSQEFTNADIDRLADEVYRQLLQELRIERDRQRTNNRHSFRNRSTRQ